VSFETCGSWLQVIVCVTLCAGCTTAKPLPSRPIRVAVGPIVMEAPVSSSTKIHSFDEEPSPEREPLVRAELIAEVEERSQRQLTEELVGHGPFQVTPFSDTRPGPPCETTILSRWPMRRVSMSSSPAESWSMALSQQNTG
jgi:hypothetical protein